MDKKKKIKLLKKVAYWLVLMVLFLIGGLVAASTFNIPGSYKFLVVQSGSMEPAIKRMGIVVVKPAEEYQKGEVITMTDPVDPEITVTHRIFEIEETEEEKLFVTKGDANDSPDSERVREEQILGKVVFAIPYLGHPVSFAKTTEGLILLIIIPAVIIIYDELRKIKEELIKIKNKKKK